MNETMTDRECAESGCLSPVRTRGLCNRHYQRARIEAGGFPRLTDFERFWSRIDFGSSSGDCWTWTLTTRVGYGAFSLKHRYYSVHRLTFEEFIGPIPDGYVIDHLCRNTRCCNPFHLEAVTSGENVLRGTGITAALVRSDTCGRGHAYSEDNTVITKSGWRKCRTCRREAWRRSNAKRRT